MKQQNLQQAPKTIRQTIADASLQLAGAGVETAELDARLLMQHAADLSHEKLILHYTDVADDQVVKKYETYVDLRKQRIPVSKILGVKSFWKHEFITNEHVLDPRPDSEILIETVLGDVPDAQQELRILELGVGSGCLILSLLSELPNATGVAVDISDEAIKVANSNANKLGLESRFSAVKSDWFENVEGEFDIIISNPPYIESQEIEDLEDEVKTFDPMSALDGGDDGLHCYREIVAALSKLSWKPKLVAFEIGCTQAGAVCQLIELNLNVDRGVIKVTKDLSGNDRIISFSL